MKGVLLLVMSMLVGCYGSLNSSEYDQGVSLCKVNDGIFSVEVPNWANGNPYISVFCKNGAVFTIRRDEGAR